ncbi:hypothetical protein SAMN05421821_101583 [Mucilaginibacter lappiensis]|uniref:Uncharacterized protein n=1 Tax=Mucilaginibacter lappiensis TaxID=354630 RepID=A0ABR6PCL1_9SPHI|nr:hypothetical protein [Mucilaginibacter lappiensis]MBB6107495.1 hypothetical protein [Mucilaginibacter lappiensis]SIQ06630.1 hypothetical protein SAMN05421821_101583 [Mucilaginibacter lappiensis]
MNLPVSILKRVYGCAMIAALLFTCVFSKASTLPDHGDYQFDRKISRKVLGNYLNRSITMQSLLVGKGSFDDNLRMIKNIGAKFIGRAVCQWGEEDEIPQNLIKEKELAAKVHVADADIILQACIFEIVTPKVEQLIIPAWAFEALGIPVQKRNFNYADMLYPDGKFKGQWGHGSVPDVSRAETKLFFYYLAKSYIDAGIEGIHFGQVELMNKNDANLDNYAQILTLIREYANKHARRHIVICDSHVPSGGFVRDGKLLMDVHAFPLRIMETPGKPEEATLQVGHTDALYLRSKGGITPSGWVCEHLPYLVEFDNYGVSKKPGEENAGDIPFWVWGYDEISWFAHQNKAYRTKWLHYAYDWLKKTDPNGHLEMPGGRQTTSPIDKKRWYYANNPNTEVPDGHGDEDTIRDIWAAHQP